MRCDTVGNLIFLEGVPSSGKTTIAKELLRRVEGLKVIHGDDEIRKRNRRRARSAHELFEAVLDKIEKVSRHQDVVVDMMLPASYLEEARKRFSDAYFISLRISEQVRIAREEQRRRKEPLEWNDVIAASQASEDAFDLVIDASASSAARCAEIILENFGTEDV